MPKLGNRTGCPSYSISVPICKNVGTFARSEAPRTARSLGMVVAAVCCVGLSGCKVMPFSFEAAGETSPGLIWSDSRISVAFRESFFTLWPLPFLFGSGPVDADIVIVRNMSALSSV